MAEGNKLTKKEQTTTTAYKMMSMKINSLEESLKKTQDESESERQQKHELDKRVVVLEARLKNSRLIEAFKLLSSCAVGLSINYISDANYQLGLPILVAGLVVYVICLFIIVD